MPQIPLIIGTVNAKQGDTYFNAFTKVEANFTELYGFHSSTVTTINVTQPSDIDDLAVGGVVTVTDVMVIRLLVPEIVITSRFFLDDSGAERPRLEITGDATLRALEYQPASPGTFITGVNCDYFQTNIGLVSRTVGSTLLATAGGVIQISGGTTRLWSDLGTHSRGDFFVRNARFAAWGAGFKINDCRSLVAQAPESLFDPPGGILFNTRNNLTDKQTIEIVGAPGFLNSNTSLARIAPDSRDSNRVSISGSTLAEGQLFDVAGVDRSYTAVVDAAVASTVINSVTSVGGLAQFNFTPLPAPLFVGQQTIVVGFVINTNYNRTIQITASGAGFFRSDSIAFIGTETTGTFTSDSVTITDTGTTFVELDGVNLDTDAATDYDGGTTIYNVLTNSYQVNRAVTGANPQTGTASTKGLNQKNNKVLAIANTNFVDSKKIACAFVNDNSDSVTGGSITNGAFRDFIFGTVGSALIECTTIEGFKLINELNGTFEVTSNDGFNGTMAYDITGVSSGGSVEFLFKWVKDPGTTEETGTHDGSNNAAIMTDSTATFTVNEFIGFTIKNTTDGSEGFITANTTTTVTATLAGGTDDDWDTSDVYEIGGFRNLDNNIERMADIGSLAQPPSGHVSMDLNKGDLIKPVFTRDSGASAFTARYFNCATTE